MARTVSIVLELDDRGSAKVKSFGKTTSDEAGRIEGALDKLGKSWEQSGQRALRLSSALTPVALAIGALEGFATRAAIKFESSFAGVRKTVDATEQQFDSLSRSLRQLAAGPQAIPVDVNQLNRIAELGGQLGREVGGLQKFVDVIARLGVTTNLAAEQGATALARFSNIMGTAEGDIDRLGSTIVDLGNNLATTEAEIVEMALRIAGAGKQIGLTEAQVLAFAGSLSSLGIEAEAGGSAISRVFVEVAKQVRSSGDLVDDFARIAGVSVKQFSDLFERDAAGAVLAFIRGLDRVSKSGGDVFTVLEGLGLENIRVRDALLRTSTATDLVSDALSRADRAWTDNNALQIESEKRFATTESRLKVVWQRLNDVAITFGERVGPAIATVAEKLVGFIERLEDLSPALQTALLATGALVAASAPLLLIYGKLSIAIGILLPQVVALAGSLSTLSLVPSLLGANLGVAFGAAGLLSGGLVALAGVTGAVLIPALTNVIGELFGVDDAFGKFRDHIGRFTGLLRDQAPEAAQRIEQMLGDPEFYQSQVRLLNKMREELLKTGKISREVFKETFVSPTLVRSPENAKRIAEYIDQLRPLKDALIDSGVAAREASAAQKVLQDQLNAPPSTEAIDALFEKLSGAGLATQKMAEVLAGDYADSLVTASKLGVDQNDVLRAYRDEIHKVVSALELAGEEMPAAFQKIFEASRQLEAIDIFFNTPTPEEMKLDMPAIGPFVGPEIPADHFKNMERTVLEIDQRIRDTKLSMLEQTLGLESSMTEQHLEEMLRLRTESENARFEAQRELHAGNQAALEALDQEHEARLDQIALEHATSRRDASLGLWIDFYEALEDRSTEFVDNIGLYWADFTDSAIQGFSALVGQMAVGTASLSQDFGKLAKQLGAQAVSLLVEWAIRRFIVGKLAVASTASEGAAAMAVSGANIFANTFASLAAIPIVGPAIAIASTPGITAGALAAAAGAGATGASLGAALALAGGAAEGGLINARRLIEVGEAGQEAIVPLRGAAAERAADAMGLSDIREELRALRQSGGAGEVVHVTVNLTVTGDNWRDNGISTELRDTIYDAVNDAIRQGRRAPLARGRG